ncbi:MAG: LysM peptidoglycan-binding domain-containing protein [Phycisphaerales bacterium]
MFTRETKILLIVGFVAVLGVAVLFVDHLSGSNRQTPAGPLDADRLASNGLVVSVLPTNQARSAPGPTDPFRSTVEGAARSLAEGGAAVVNGVEEHIDEWRERSRPESASQTVDREAGSDDVPSIKMGEPLIVDADGLVQVLAGVRTHRVAPGQTLWGIADEYYGDPSLHTALAAYNRDRLTSAGQARAGATILIPERAVLLGGAGAGTEREIAQTPTPTPRPNGAATAARVYVVKKGDTLSEISQRELGTSRRWEEILKLNSDRLESASDLWVGMKLNLPAR